MERLRGLCERRQTGCPRPGGRSGGRDCCAGGGASYWVGALRACSLPGSGSVLCSKALVWVTLDFPFGAWDQGKHRAWGSQNSEDSSPSSWALYLLFQQTVPSSLACPPTLDPGKHENASRGDYDLSLYTLSKIFSPGRGWSGSPKPYFEHSLGPPG